MNTKWWMQLQKAKKLKNGNFLPQKVFILIVDQSLMQKQKKKKQERADMIHRALRDKIKVLAVEENPTCSGGHRIDYTRGVVHINCKNGQDGLWYWIRRDHPEKICENCETISEFTHTVCTLCNGHVSTRVYASPP